MSEFNVLIVDDSPFMRKVFSDFIDADAAFKVLATASNGMEAVDLALKLKPDIITMDLEMPQMNGLEALQRIMAIHPVPVIMLSAVTDNGTRNTIKALHYGAFDFIRKPDGAVKLDIQQVGLQLLEKLHIAVEMMKSGNFRMLPAVEEKVESTAMPGAIVLKPAEPLKEENKNPLISADPISQKVMIKADLPTVDPPQLKGVDLTAKKETNTINLNPPLAPLPTSYSGITKPKLPELRQAPETARNQEIKNVSEIEKKLPANRLTKAIIPSDKPASATIKAKINYASTTFTHLVAIGTSTGGPRALHEVLTGLPADFPAPVLIVQHMPPKFTHSLAQRLDSFCSIHVREAVDGEPLETATAYIAPGGKHMSLGNDGKGNLRIKLSEEGPRGGHMPSVDVLFESLIGHQQLKRHIVLMTGMGSDGARGMKALQSDGALTTIAEAEQTCVVYGMPRSAVELGAVSHLLPLQGIASTLIHKVKHRN
ncbi:chemotaxis response regulator protein-glutamate methylesterase [Cohnella sp.]|uniref:protein-glutamate methylesterase/protein-glutamine glutaminase n=1 Tax=Cohnella sp. TaxID=1883426 RepID=UPI003569A3B1